MLEKDLDTLLEEKKLVIATKIEKIRDVMTEVGISRANHPSPSILSDVSRWLAQGDVSRQHLDELIEGCDFLIRWAFVKEGFKLTTLKDFSDIYGEEDVEILRQSLRKLIQLRVLLPDVDWRIGLAEGIDLE